MPLVIYDARSDKRLGFSAGVVEIQTAIVEEGGDRILFDAAVQVAPPAWPETSSYAQAQVEGEIRFGVTEEPAWVELFADLESELRIERRQTGPIAGATRIELTARIQDLAAKVYATKRFEDWLNFEGNKKSQNDSSRMVRLEPGVYIAACKAEIRAQADRPGAGFARAVLKSGSLRIAGDGSAAGGAAGRSTARP
jgi:hypothetical protein